jgi:fructose-specific phosphotransferase system component IIB
MKQCKFVLRAWVLPLTLIAAGCGLMEEPKPKNAAPFGLITTPASYYSTPKARYLGDKYKTNLDRLVERIVRNPKTASLQFANNIASVGGIGFFTHSAATTPDERYLEIVLAAPETFETGGDHSGKLNQLFTSYGIELLSILASDSEIYQEKDVSGYGLNLSWRKVVREASGPRVTLERAVAYFPKQKVRGFLRQEVSQNDLLQVAVIFAVEEDGPMKLVTYSPVEPKPDFRPPIREQTLAATPVEPKAEAELATPVSPTPQTVQTAQVEKKAAGSQNEQQLPIEKTSTDTGAAAWVEKRGQSGASSTARDEKVLSSNLVVDKATSETKKANEVVEQRSVKQSPVTNAINRIQEPSAATVSPKKEATPSFSPPETGQVVPNMVPKDDSQGSEMATDEVAIKTELPRDKTVEVIAKPEVAAKKIETTNAERSAAFNQSSTVPAPATSASEGKQDKTNESKTPELRPPTRIQEVRVPESAAVAPTTKSETSAVSQSYAPNVVQHKEDRVRETKSQDQVVVEAKTKKEPELDTPLSEKTTESKIVASEVETKAPAVLPLAASKVAQSNDENVSDAKFESPVLVKEKESNASEFARPLVEKTPERVIVAPQPETQAAAVSPPPVRKGIPSKEDVGAAVSKSSVVAQGESLKTLEQPKVVQDRPIVALKPEIKAATVAQPSPVELPLAKEETGSKTDGPSAVVTKPEITRLPGPGAPIESKKAEHPVVALKSEPESVVVVQPVDPKANAAGKESANKARPSGIPMAKAEAVKMPDVVKSAQEKKPEPAVAAPKFEANPPGVTIQNQVAAGEKEPQFASKVESMKEQPDAGIPSPVAPAEVKAPTVKRPFEERAPAAQTQVPDKPANEQMASLAKKPAEISTKQKPLPLEQADVKAPEVMPPPAQPAPAAQAKVPGKPANEQIALLTKKPAEVIPEKKPLPLPAPKALEGYIIQLSFSERGEAQRWAENLTAEGYAVSMTEAGTNAFRVRIGNFAVRPEAERRLKTLGQQGLKGIVLNLPQAYRPDTSRSAEATADAISVTP